MNYKSMAVVAVLFGFVGADAAAQRVLVTPSQAWQQWRDREPTVGASDRDSVRRLQGESDARREAIRSARSSGARAGFNAASDIGNHIAAALGATESAEDAVSTLEALEGEANRRGMGRAASAARSLRRALERSGLVDPADAASEPVDAPDGQPDVPSSCEGNPACAMCYGEVVSKLDDTRYRLERLRAIYSSTVSEAKAKIAFADGVSAVHGVSALAWQKNKIGVMKSLKNLDQSYDKKYVELMEALLGNLKDFGACEESVMRVPDWYDRFGYVYYLFMKDRYKRPAI